MAHGRYLWNWTGIRSYQQASPSDVDVDGNKGDYQSGATRSLGLYYVTGFMAVLVLMAVAYLSTVSRRGAFDCGFTISEARSKKCHFEPMQRAWIPDACYFPEPRDEYNPFSDRNWYLDDNFQVRAHPESLEAGEVLVAYVADFHQEHCTYNWRKLAIAVEMKRKRVDSRVGNVHHATHCALGLAEQTKNMSACAAPGSVRTLTKSNLNFLECVDLR